MPKIFDFDLTLTKKHTFDDHKLRYGNKGKLEIPPTHDSNNYLEQEYNKGQNGYTNLKDNVPAFLNYTDNDIIAVATFHNNPNFVAGYISRILTTELISEDLDYKTIDGGFLSNEIKVGVSAYKDKKSDKLFLISFIPYINDDYKSAISILKNKNAQIQHIRDIWIKKSYIKPHDEIDFYEDSAEHLNAAASLGYIKGHLVDANNDEFTATDYTVEPVAEESTAEESTAEESTGLSFSNISMMVLGGFIAAAGITAIALAFTVLNAATLGVPGLLVAGAGIAAGLTGTGLFAYGIKKEITQFLNEKSFEIVT